MALASHWTRKKRFILGVCILFIVVLIWVASSELSNFIFMDEDFDKPFFSSYYKISMFSIFLLGFIGKPWRKMVCPEKIDDVDPGISEEDKFSPGECLGPPIYVPIRDDDAEFDNHSVENQIATVERSINDNEITRSVRFNQLSEVRHLCEYQAEDAALARLSYTAYIEAQEIRHGKLLPLSLSQIARLAFMFTLLFFLGNYSYQIALSKTYPGVVNLLSSTSSFFTLILASVFPGSSQDKFNLSKFFAVVLSVSGIVIVCYSDAKLEVENLKAGFPYGVVWSLTGALTYSLYIVLLRRRVDHEDRLSLPMFFGFVGLFALAVLWPGFFILHYTKVEPFQFPNSTQWMFMTVNGLVGTVASELLWLWGCFLTSSLVATLSLSLTIPLTMFADFIIKKKSYDWMLYVGSVPVFVGFILVVLLSHYESVDPVGRVLRRLFPCCFRRHYPIPSPTASNGTVIRTKEPFANAKRPPNSGRNVRGPHSNPPSRKPSLGESMLPGRYSMPTARHLDRNCLQGYLPTCSSPYRTRLSRSRWLK